MFENIRIDLDNELLPKESRFELANKMLATTLLLGNILNKTGLLDIDVNKFELETLLHEFGPGLNDLLTPLLISLFEKEHTIKRESLVQFMKDVKLVTIHEVLLEQIKKK